MLVVISLQLHLISQLFEMESVSQEKKKRKRKSNDLRDSMSVNVCVFLIEITGCIEIDNTLIKK